MRQTRGNAGKLGLDSAKVPPDVFTPRSALPFIPTWEFAQGGEHTPFELSRFGTPVVDCGSATITRTFDEIRIGAARWSFDGSANASQSARSGPTSKIKTRWARFRCAEVLARRPRHRDSERV